MTVSVHRRTIVRILTFALALIVCLAAASIINGVKAVRYKRSVEYSHQRALLSLSEALDSIDLTLQKSLYAGSATQFTALASKLHADSATAKADLGQLPSQSGELNDINKFISQVGDYASSLAEKLSLDEDITKEERDRLVSLRSYASKLRSSVSRLFSEYIEKGVSLEETTDAVESGSDAPRVSGGSSSLSALAEEFTDYPTLIYDGPFSDHMYDRTPRALENERKINRDAAMQKAREFSPSSAALSFAETIESRLPCYVFRSDTTDISVTIQGGRVAYLINSRRIGASTIDREDAEKLASDFLSERGYKGMQSQYYEISDGRCVMNFTLNEDDITLYPDQVKVGIALDNGEVVLFDATDYLMNHTERELPKELRSEQEAAKIVSRQLEIKGSNLTLIPSDSLKESLCYEFLCSAPDGSTVLVYVNAQNLVEENILVLMESRNGQLTL